MDSSTLETLATSLAPADLFLDSTAPGRPDLTSLHLEDAPAYHDDWSPQNPLIHLLFHRDIITHLVWCSAGCRYLTGGADGAVKLWRSEVQSRAPPLLKTSSSVKRNVLIPEVHVTTLGGPVTDLRVSEKDVGNSEVAVIASTDGTLTLCRTGTGEVIRTLRGVRGESLSVFSETTVPQGGSAHAGLNSARPGKGVNAGSPAEVDRQLANRFSRTPTWYAADAYSSQFAAAADNVVVRRPVYMVRAYKSEAREVLAGPSSEYFKGLRTVAPTYEHLAPHVEKISDILAQFSLAPTTTTHTGPLAEHRQWYASAIALAAAPPVIHASKPSSNGVSLPPSALDPFLLLGFPQGLLQVYVLPQRWFSLHQHGETRLDPPAVRTPVFSGLLHTAAVLCVDVIRSRDVVISVSEDGTTQLRRLSCLHVPLRQLGVAISLPREVTSVAPSPSMGASSSSTRRQRLANTEGHSRFITCCCVDGEQQLLVTGSTDHSLCWWSLTTGSSSSPIRVVSLRDLAGSKGSSRETHSSLSNTLAPEVRGGYPVGVSFFRRGRSASYGKSASPVVVDPDDGVSSSASPTSSSVPLLLLVLDTERGVRIFDALSAKLITYAFDSRPAGATTAGVSSGSFNKMIQGASVARYDCANGVERVLVGGRCLVSWYVANSAESGVTRGHTTPIIFTGWCASLRCVVTADVNHILLWQLHAEEQEEPIAKVLRAWFFPTGIRSVALCDTSVTDDAVHPHRPSLIIAHASETSIGEYDCLLQDSSTHLGTSRLPQPRILRQLRVNSGVSVDALVTATVVASTNTPASKARTAEGPTTYALAACHSMRRTADEELYDVSEDGRLCVYPLRWSSATSAPGSDCTLVGVRGATELIAPQRSLRLYKSDNGDSSIIAGVLGLPCVNRLVLGGRRVLYSASLCSTTTSALPCQPLPLSVQALQPVALFPGPLISLDDSAAIDTVDDGTAEQAIGDTGVAPVLTDLSITGFLSRLVHISHDTAAGAPDNAERPACLVLSGSNDGLLQLWDVQHDRELWQCCAVPTHEAITALTVHQCAVQCLVAVGDQSGVVTLLDLTKVVQSARLIVTAAARAPRHSLENVPEWSRWGLERVEAQMLERWLAHGDAICGILFTTAPAGASDKVATSLQLLTTGEDSAVMVWALPSWTLQPGSPVLPNDELSGIPLFRPSERAHAKSCRLPINPMRVQTNRVRLPWAARQAYEPWRQQYVRRRLLGGKSTALSVALTRFYRNAKSSGGTAAGESKNVETSQEESEEEAKLIDRAWAVLSADVDALSRSFALPSAQGEASRPRTVVQAWCTSLSQSADAEFTDAALLRSSPATGHQPHFDKSGDSASCEVAKLSSVALGAEGGGVTPLFSSLIFAFADRCCDGRATGRRSPTRHQDASALAKSSSSVRECLRQAIRVVVRSSIEQASPLRASAAAVPPQQGSNTADGATRSSLTADPKAPSNKSTPLPGRPLFDSDAISGPVEVVCIEGSKASPHRTALSMALGDPPDGVTLNIPADEVVEDPGAMPQRHVGFTVSGDEHESAPSLAAAADFESQPVRQTITYHVGYSARAPLVWSSPMDRPGSSSEKHGRILRSTFENTGFETTIESSTSRLSGQLLPGGNETGNSQSLSTLTDAQHGGLSGGVAATVIQHVNRARRREKALQRLIALEQDDLHLQCHATARARPGAKRNQVGIDAMDPPVFRGGYVALGLPMRRMRKAPPVTKRAALLSTGKQPRTHTRSSLLQSVAPQSPAVNPQSTPQVVVADSYLMPVLARFGTSGLLTPSGRTAAASATRATNINATVASAGSTALSNSEHSLWYAERQRCREIAREKARLWNTQRVMKTLLAWTVTSAESSSDISESKGVMPEGGHIINITPSTDTATTASRTASPPILAVPEILELESPTADFLTPLTGTDSPVTEDVTMSPGASVQALTTLLHVAPTTAIDAAVPTGLPSRKTLQDEMLAAKLRMRQTVRLRATYQREQRARAASALSTEPLTAAEGGNDSSSNVDEELSIRDSDGLSEGQSGAEKPASAGAVRSGSHAKQVNSYQNVSAAASVSPMGKSGCAPRRALQPHEGAEPRRMATVPLPTATTRQELFGRNTRRRK
ncbi:hypothetical protein JKF63_01055 [Porcisia hertigi]|uniref:Guanine nucleotide-binding protein subunit beta-like protein n=1 Tax=Porcisia hertigi TaxID=2761500 RepID=A0A836H2H4_9TRYP|nr:hypothetical protein JKF63_01055 [Porcisia hertigi]